jgi:chromosome partitioning protein
LKVISFTNQKGGAGKSTLAINLAVAAERTGERVCIVDLDQQGTSPTGSTREPPRRRW